MAKIREELEIVSSDDLNSLLNRLNKLKMKLRILTIQQLSLRQIRQKLIKLI